jgi:hypothetical protein
VFNGPPLDVFIPRRQSVLSGQDRLQDALRQVGQRPANLNTEGVGQSVQGSLELGCPFSGPICWSSNRFDQKLAVGAASICDPPFATPPYPETGVRAMSIPAVPIRQLDFGFGSTMSGLPKFALHSDYIC